MEIQELAAQYESRSDEELLRLALFPEQLTPEALMTLTNELVKRGINGAEQLNAFRKAEEERKIEQERNPDLFIIHHWGIGRMRFGKADRIYNADTGVERFKTTIFIVLFWMPLIPTGTYLAERRRKSFSSRIFFREKLPLDWRQVLKVWIVTAACIFGIIGALGLLIRFS